MSRYPPLEEPEDLTLDSHFHSYLIESNQTYEPQLLEIFNYISTLQTPNDKSKIENRKIVLKTRSFRIQDNQFYKKFNEKFVLVPPIENRESILREVHDGHGHFGRGLYLFSVSK